MLSICIPVYNFYVYPLARRLANQARNINAEVEIVCIDDHSSSFYEGQNKALPEVATYIRLSENVGRAKIRNLFLKYAKGEYMLFLDDDSVVPDNFLKLYIRQIASNPQVVVGGRTYDGRGNDTEHRLRYLYGVKVESRTEEQRKRRPYQSFMTNNFMIRRDVLEKIRFDESIVKYGHEDTVFGYRLEQNKIPIVHIDNPVVNGQVEDNVEFLHKSVEAVENLVKIYDNMWEDQRFCHSVRLLRTYGRVRRMGLTKLFYAAFKLLKAPIESHFVNGNAISLRQFGFYKLGVFIQKLEYADK